MMAERRMFAKSIVTSDAFLDMPMSARCLYFTLGMFADDDGFVNNPKSIMRQVGSTTDDMNVLVAKRFVIVFESGVIVIKHWRIHNYIQSDRYHPTKYQDEMNCLFLDDNKSYKEKDCERIQSVSITDTEDRLGKDRIGEDRLGEGNAKFMASVKEIVSYLNETVGTNYKPSSGYIQTLIHARMADKFTVDDFKTVIWKKAREWKGTDMEKYLRPQTLFGTKFESYLNQIGDVGQHDAMDDFLKGEDNDETGIW